MTETQRLLTAIQRTKLSEAKTPEDYERAVHELARLAQVALARERDLQRHEPERGGRFERVGDVLPRVVRGIGGV